MDIQLRSMVESIETHAVFTVLNAAVSALQKEGIYLSPDDKQRFEEHLHEWLSVTVVVK